MTKTMTEMFDKYRDRVDCSQLDEDEVALIRDAMLHAFYSGAACLMMELDETARDGNLDEQSRVDHYSGLKNEIKAFFDHRIYANATRH